MGNPCQVATALRSVAAWRRPVSLRSAVWQVKKLGARPAESVGLTAKLTMELVALEFTRQMTMEGDRFPRVCPSSLPSVNDSGDPAFALRGYGGQAEKRLTITGDDYG